MIQLDAQDVQADALGLPRLVQKPVAFRFGKRLRDRLARDRFQIEHATTIQQFLRNEVRRIRLSSAARDGRVCLSVSDNRSGIAAEQQEAGLALCKYIVGRNDGLSWFEMEPGSPLPCGRRAISGIL